MFDIYEFCRLLIRNGRKLVLIFGGAFFLLALVAISKNRLDKSFECLVFGGLCCFLFKLLEGIEDLI
jgi:hypothetical protein